MLLLTLNANINEGQLLLDMEAGFVYFRMKFVPNEHNSSPEAIQAEVARMESQGVMMCGSYARIIAEEFGLQ